MEEGNEATNPVTAEVWAEHGLWPQDPGFWRALAGGVTTLQTLPGSANLIGARGVTLKLVPGMGATDMLFPGAPMVANFSSSVAGGSRGGASLRLREVLEDARFWHDDRAAFDAGGTRGLSA